MQKLSRLFVSRLTVRQHRLSRVPAKHLQVKGNARVHEGDIRSLLALRADGPVKKCCVVCLEKEPRKIHPAIEVLPWRIFLTRLWNGDFC